MVNPPPETWASPRSRILLGPLLRPWGWLLLATIVYSPWIDTGIGVGNVASDLAAIESLGDRGTFFINDSTFEGTIDKFKRPDGFFFSQKSPVFHLVAVVPYIGLRWLGFRLASDTALCLRVLTFFMVILPMGWLLWLIFENPWMRIQRGKTRLWLTAGFAGGSLLTPFAVTFNHYILASACLMCAVNRIVAYGIAGRKPDGRLGLWAGVWISASLACDVPPAFIFGAGVGVLWLLTRSWQGLVGLAAGAAPILLLYCALNQAIIGSPLPPNMHEREMLYYQGSFWKEMEDRAEKFGPAYYQASYGRRLFHSVLGHKGIYWMMPLLAVATLAAARAARRRDGAWELASAFAVLPLATIAVTMRWSIDLSGGAYAIRHVFATVPPLYCVLGRCEWTRVSTRRTGLACGLWGCGIGAIGIMNPWSHNTLSAIPPIENLARHALHHAARFPTDWIQWAIRNTSVDPATGWLDLGLEHLAARRLTEAEEALHLAIAANPEIGLPYYHLGIALDLQGRSAEAAEAYQPLLKLEPENLGAWNNLGIFELKLRRVDKAKAAYARADELAPDNASSLWGRLIIEEMEGRTRADSPLLARALRLHPNDVRLQELARKWEGAPGRIREPR